MIPLFLAAVFTFSSDRIDVKIDDASGVLVSLVDRRDGVKLLEKSCDRYVLQRAPKDETAASEADDRVVQRRGDVLVCENPKLPGLTIEKNVAHRGTLADQASRVSHRSYGPWDC